VHTDTEAHFEADTYSDP
jgi:hypothetical protein